eukprot:443536-Rhodomonas_salina.1
MDELPEQSGERGTVRWITRKFLVIVRLLRLSALVIPSARRIDCGADGAGPLSAVRSAPCDVCRAQEARPRCREADPGIPWQGKPVSERRDSAIPFFPSHGCRFPLVVSGVECGCSLESGVVCYGVPLRASEVEERPASSSEKQRRS